MILNFGTISSPVSILWMGNLSIQPLSLILAVNFQGLSPLTASDDAK